MEPDLKAKIKEEAVRQFNEHGYYGATIRNLAREVGCSLPMIYYHYQNKRDLFSEIIQKDYFELLSSQAASAAPYLEAGVTEFYTQFVYKLQMLSEYEKKVYRLGIKVYLGFDGDEELQRLMNEWEKTILARHTQIVLSRSHAPGNHERIVRTLIHLLENLVESVIVKNRYFSHDELHEEIALILRDLG